MTHGGTRKGAGRRSQYGCETKPIRVPTDLLPAIQQFIQCKGFNLPLYESKVPAGVPAPADDTVASHIDLNQHLVKDPATTFLVRVTGDSMINAGIQENDLLIVDRSATPNHGKIVVAAIDGELTVKRLHKNVHGQFILMPENPRYAPIELNDENHVLIWGVVSKVIHSV